MYCVTATFSVHVLCYCCVTATFSVHVLCYCSVTPTFSVHVLCYCCITATFSVHVLCYCYVQCTCAVLLLRSVYMYCVTAAICRKPFQFKAAFLKSSELREGSAVAFWGLKRVLTVYWRSEMCGIWKCRVYPWVGGGWEGKTPRDGFFVDVCY